MVESVMLTAWDPMSFADGSENTIVELKHGWLALECSCEPNRN
jgi:hypothetical protein